jgi:predicted transcriptional regulator of viral defense system
LIPLRKGIYLLARPYRHRDPSLDSIANLLVTPSYVSLERALSIHGLIPERVPLIQSVTTSRPVTYETEVGDFRYRHVHTRWFFGYRAMSIGDDEVLVALPEKALLDWVHLSKGEVTLERLEELRLQDVDRLDAGLLTRMARAGRPRVQRAAERIRALIEREQKATTMEL